MANATGKKFGGRTKGTPNKCTAQAKALLVDLIAGQTDRNQEAPDKVFECNKREYLQIMVRLLPYAIPKAEPERPTECEKLSWLDY